MNYYHFLIFMLIAGTLRMILLEDSILTLSKPSKIDVNLISNFIQKQSQENHFIQTYQNTHWSYKNWSTTFLPRNQLMKCLNKKRIMFLGTSYLREIYFETVKILENTDALGAKRRFIPSYHLELSKNVSTCDSKRIMKDEIDDSSWCLIGSKRCNLPGPAGVNLDLCGMPHNKTEVVGLDTTLHFQFKTYLHTPEADKRVADFIKSQEKFDLFVIGSAEWGSNKFIKTNYTEQAQRYVKTIISALDDDTPVIFFYNNGYNKSSKYLFEALKMYPQVSVFDMKNIKKDISKLGITPNGHGFKGPVTQVLGHVVLDSICA